MGCLLSGKSGTTFDSARVNISMLIIMTIIIHNYINIIEEQLYWYYRVIYCCNILILMYGYYNCYIDYSNDLISIFYY